MREHYRRYVAIGDSSTEGLFDPDERGGYRGWADRLAERIARAQGGIGYANLAVRGRLTRQIRDEQLGEALSLEPDLATVVTGMNDLLRPSFDLHAVGADIEEMLAALSAGGATVLTFTFPDPVPVNRYARFLERRFRALNERIRVAATNTGAVLVDFEAEPIASDPRLWCEDRLHANPEGHARIAGAIAATLGIAGEGPAWNEPLSPMERRRRRETLAAELAWGRRYLLPWVGRRVRRVSSGDGIAAKRPQLTPIDLES